MSTAAAVPTIAAGIIAAALAAVTIRVWIGRAGEVIDTLTADVRDPRIDALPPDPTDGRDYDPDLDEEGLPGTEPRRNQEAM
ncbi:hypothetical protein GCM10010182_67270 [Actinomadura cremea]|nr:hypothetical protein GCM10010182_67270 [Actinomadura cremea]